LDFSRCPVPVGCHFSPLFTKKWGKERKAALSFGAASLFLLKTIPPFFPKTAGQHLERSSDPSKY